MSLIDTLQTQAHGVLEESGLRKSKAKPKPKRKAKAKAKKKATKKKASKKSPAKSVPLTGKKKLTSKNAVMAKLLDITGKVSA